MNQNLLNVVGLFCKILSNFGKISFVGIVWYLVIIETGHNKWDNCCICKTVCNWTFLLILEQFNKRPLSTVYWNVWFFVFCSLTILFKCMCSLHFLQHCVRIEYRMSQLWSDSLSYVPHGTQSITSLTISLFFLIVTGLILESGLQCEGMLSRAVALLF